MRQHPPDELLGRFVAEDVTVHPGTPGTAPDAEGPDQFRESFRGFRATFPGLHVTLYQVLAEDDLVAARWTASGTTAGGRARRRMVAQRRLRLAAA